jgi:hypothetical protein
MTGEFTEFFKGASPLRGGSPGAALGGGTWGATAIADTVLISTRMTSCVIFLTQVNSIMPASGAVVTTISTSGVVTLTCPAICSGTWIAFGY